MSFLIKAKSRDLDEPDVKEFLSRRLVRRIAVDEARVHTPHTSKSHWRDSTERLEKRVSNATKDS
jgi:hypothetical protein